MEIICAYCGKIITNNGEVYKGNAYHEVCFKSFKVKNNKDRIYTLSQTFPRIDCHILEELFECYEYSATGLDMLTKKMKKNWCIITELDGDDRQLDYFDTKNNMFYWLTHEIKTALADGYSFDVLYILNKGKPIKSVNQFEIKIKLI